MKKKYIVLCSTSLVLALFHPTSKRDKTVISKFEVELPLMPTWKKCDIIRSYSLTQLEHFPLKHNIPTYLQCIAVRYGTYLIYCTQTGETDEMREGQTDTDLTDHIDQNEIAEPENGRKLPHVGITLMISQLLMYTEKVNIYCTAADM